MVDVYWVDLGGRWGEEGEEVEEEEEKEQKEEKYEKKEKEGEGNGKRGGGNMRKLKEDEDAG